MKLVESILNEQKRYQELKESVRMMNSHRSDAEKVSLIEVLMKLLSITKLLITV